MKNEEKCLFAVTRTLLLQFLKAFWIINRDFHLLYLISYWMSLVYKRNLNHSL